ncbi:MFS transporter [Rhodoligotrophos defluvii]|uniref:MFS transporter n=1 Tax=Rhodoligotrophos defluvii TaxID=2561934 RepID=UPI0010C98F5B|nr:MFS transporter [Rhodoligotrophos defluvii]
MDQATSRLPGRSAADWRVTANVSAAHFISHFYLLVLPPLMPFINRDLGIGYTELALLVSVLNLVTTVLQTPAGVLADRMDRVKLLIGALILGATGFALTALVPVYGVFVLAFAAAGAANAIYHPADYAILSERVSPRRVSTAFSIHTFSGFIGSAAAPASLAFIAYGYGWQAAMWVSAALGYAVALLLLVQQRWLKSPASHPGVASQPAGGRDKGEQKSSLALLASPEILRNTLIWVLLALAGTGVQTYGALTWHALHDLSLDFVNLALSAYLLAMAVGILLGGMIAGRTPRHNLVAALGLIGAGVLLLAGGVVPLGPIMVLGLAAAAGLLNGVVLPSRDLIVRSVTAPGTYGRAFAIVSTGLSIGGIIAPLVFGLLYDHGQFAAIFLSIGAVYLLGAALVLMPARRAGA